MNERAHTEGVAFMDADELKLSRLSSQFLLEKADGKSVVSGLIGLQAQYGANAMHALLIRSNTVPDWTRYVKTWTLRGTLHLHAKSDLPLVLHAGCQTEFGQMAFLDERVDRARSESFRRLVLSSLEDGDKTRDELKALCNAKGLSAAEEDILFHAWGGLFRAMAEHGEVAYTSDGNRVFTKLAPFTPMDEQTALEAMVRRYLLHYGPVTLRDAQTFFGRPQRELKPILERNAQETILFGNQTYFSAGQKPPQSADMPGVVFLAGFDPLLLGYRKTENPFLSKEHVKQIYNNTGIVFPAVLLNGVVSAVWKRAGNRIEIRSLKKIGARDKKRIERKAAETFGGAAVRWADA